MKILVDKYFIPLELVDLIIRPSGECRLSNFCFGNAPIPSFASNVLWPDFDKKHMLCYSGLSNRNRRYGSDYERATNFGLIGAAVLAGVLLPIPLF